MKIEICKYLLLLLTVHAHGWNCFKNCKKKKPTHLPTPNNCLKPPVLGYCKPLENAWYYNYEKRKCTKVDPSLCGTGKNLFAKEEHCKKACGNPVGVAQIHCLTPPILTSAWPLLQSWYFEIQCSCCKRFNYTLGAASANSFASEIKCQEVCQPNKTPKAVCSQKPESELCLVSKRRWHFDQYKNMCFRFKKSRCAKNNNGFVSLKKCMERCSYFLPTTVSNST